jgi:hypothetical protein
VTVGHHVNVVAYVDVTTMYVDVPWLHYHGVTAKGFKTRRDEMADIPLLENSNQVFNPQWSVIMNHKSVGLAVRMGLSVTNTLCPTETRFHSRVN